MSSPSSRNQILSQLPPDELARLAPHLQDVVLSPRRRLERIGHAPEVVYFIDTGVCAMEGALAPSGAAIALVGSEGVTGLSGLISDTFPKFDVVVQFPGVARRAPLGVVKRLFESEAGRSLRGLVLRYVYALQTQLASAALANATLDIESRLARWLLMLREYGHSDELRLTHEAIAASLGVRRAGVTTALGDLHEAGAVVTHRGVITIVDNRRLKSFARESYERSEPWLV